MQMFVGQYGYSVTLQMFFLYQYGIYSGHTRVSKLTIFFIISLAHVSLGTISTFLCELFQIRLEPA